MLIKKLILFTGLLCVISLICGWHHLVGFFYLKTNYTLFALNSSTMNREEVYAFMMRTRQVLNGSLYPHDNQVHEYQNTVSPFVNETLPAYFMAIFSIITSSLEKSFILIDFILPPIIFILFYFFLRMLTKSYWVAIVASLGAVLVRDFIVYLPYPRATFNFLFGQEKFIDFLVITRSFHPEVSIVFLLLAVFFICKAFSFSNNIGRFKIAAGIFFGFTFYTYIYHWTAIVFSLVLFLLFNISNKKLRNTAITIILIGFVIGLPAIINLIEFKFSIYANDFFERASNLRFEFPLSESRRFICISLILAFLLRREPPRVIYLNTLIFSAAILPDVSLFFLKRDLQSLHWIWIIVLPFAAILYFYIFDKFILFKLSVHFKRISYFLLALSFIFYGIKVQTASANKFSKYQQLSRDEKSLIQELGKLPIKSVVMIYSGQNQKLTNLNSFIPAITENYVFVPSEIMTISPTNEIIDRNLIAFSFVSPINNITEKDHDLILMNSYTSNNRAYIKTNHSYLINNIEKKIKNLSQLCRRYAVDYAVLEGHRQLLNSCYESKLIFSNKTYALWEILKSQK